MKIMTSNTSSFIDFLSVEILPTAFNCFLQLMIKKHTFVKSFPHGSHSAVAVD